MDTQSSMQKIAFALILLIGEYVLLGWYLAAHHVFWLVATFIVGFTFTVVWKKNPILDLILWIFNKPVVVVIGISFLFSLFVAFVVIRPALLSLILLPSITLLYALVEMRSANIKQANVLLWAVIITGLGLGIGEAIDLFITPSMRY